MPGIYPAVMTGYTAEGAVDVAATLGLVDRLMDQGAHGLFVGGTAGEGLVQTVVERRELNEAILSHVDGRVPAIVHVGATVFTDTVDLARHALDHGAEDVAAIPPLYYALRERDLDDYFRQLSATLGRPVMAYHVPNLTNRPTTSTRLSALAHEGALSGVKFSADDLSQVQDVIESTADVDFRLFSGSDPICLDAQVIGSSGAVGVSMNAMTGLFTAQWDAVSRGDLATAFTSQRLINRFVAHMFRFNFIAYLRLVLELQGVHIGPNRAPLPNLTASEREQILAFLRGDEELRTALELPSQLS